MNQISVDAAAVVTETSRSTWRRRIADGAVVRLPADGKRTMLSIDDVSPLLSVPMDTEDLEYLAAADAGDAEAQDDMGSLFLDAGKNEIAVYWFAQAAEQGHANAMQMLGVCYAGGMGVPKNEDLALMWIAKAAAHGHVIARQQTQALRDGVLG